MNKGKNRHKNSSIHIMAITVIGAIMGGIVINKSIKGNNSEYKELGIFEPGEHIVSIPVDDITDKITVYEGHIGYKPIGINVNSLSEEINDSGTIVFVNTTEVKAKTTGISDSGDILFEDFGTPINYNYELSSNEYEIGQHIISVPCDCGDKSGIEEYNGYNIVGIVRTTFCDNVEYDGCILYANEEPVEYNNETNSYFGTPIEKQKVLEK